MAQMPGPAGIALSNIIRGMGYASAGIIAGQAIASFEGGGYIADGPRIGGVDNRGGKYAILHPNESIIDHNKQQSAQPTQIINIAPQLQDVSHWDSWYKQNRNRIARDVRSTGRV